VAAQPGRTTVESIKEVHITLAMKILKQWNDGALPR